MKIFKKKRILQKNIGDEKNLSFIPTMGALHKGHEYLIKNAKKKYKKVIVSIFVNPKQFNSTSDFKSYPRNIRKDINLLKKLKVNYLYLPSYSDLFSLKVKRKIYLHKFSKDLCGKFRPKHFRGVINVINRLLDIIKPKYILLGKKDFQQLYLIKKYIEKYKIKTTVIGCNTVRKENGVAYSSRNKNLSLHELNLASKVFKILRAEKKYLKRKPYFYFHKNNLLNKLKVLGVRKVEYIKCLDLKKLKKPKKSKSNFNIFIAYYLNKTRLIDNL